MSGQRECKLKPGDRFASQADAARAEFNRKVNSAVNGQNKSLGYRVDPCRCGGFHLSTAAQRENAYQRRRRAGGQSGRRRK